LVCGGVEVVGFAVIAVFAVVFDVLAIGATFQVSHAITIVNLDPTLGLGI
jgi:hypothetical protein